MGRKKKAPAHENLERWFVSYADFITLLFATFVVLYALSQTDVAQYDEMLKNIQKSFNSSLGLMQGEQNILDNTPAQQNNSVVEALMLEYLNPTYEEESFKEIKKSVDQLVKENELEGVSASIDERGLILKLDNSDILFKSASADLTEKAKKALDRVGLLIAKKFLMHAIRIEGNTDNLPLTNSIYPSNWELSAARACAIVRYLIDRFQLMSGLFTAVGYGDTRKIADNNTEAGRIKNRRVEIIVLRNKYKKNESVKDEILKMNKKEQQAYLDRYYTAMNDVLGVSDAAMKLQDKEKESSKKVIKLNEIYFDESSRIDEITKDNKNDKLDSDLILIDTNKE